MLQCARDRMLNNIMVSDKEFVGIALLGVQGTANAAAATNGAAGTSTSTASDVAILFEVSRPGADILKKLNSYIKSTGKYVCILCICIYHTSAAINDLAIYVTVVWAGRSSSDVVSCDIYNNAYGKLISSC